VEEEKAAGNKHMMVVVEEYANKSHRWVDEEVEV